MDAYLELSTAAKSSEWYDATCAALVKAISKFIKETEDWNVHADRLAVDFAATAVSYRAPLRLGGGGRG